MTREEMFPLGSDPEEWNGGEWPPRVYRERWEAFYLAVLGSTRREGNSEQTARAAQHQADWAVRLEMERHLRAAERTEATIAARAKAGAQLDDALWDNIVGEFAARIAGLNRPAQTKVIVQINKLHAREELMARADFSRVPHPARTPELMQLQKRADDLEAHARAIEWRFGRRMRQLSVIQELVLHPPEDLVERIQAVLQEGRDEIAGVPP